MHFTQLNALHHPTHPKFSFVFISQLYLSLSSSTSTTTTTTTNNFPVSGILGVYGSGLMATEVSSVAQMLYREEEEEKGRDLITRDFLGGCALNLELSISSQVENTNGLMVHMFLRSLFFSFFLFFLSLIGLF